MATNDSPMPFIKNEPDDSHFDPNQYMASANHSTAFHNPGQQYGGWGGSMGNIDPAELSMNGTSLQSAFGSQQNLPSSLAVGDDELEDLINLPDTSSKNNAFQQPQNGFIQNNNFMGMHNASAPVTGQNQYMNAMYSNTPDGFPIQSPFLNGPTNFPQWGTGHQSQNNFNHSGPSSAKAPGRASEDFGIRVGFRPDNRNSTDSMSPMTPKTRLANLQLGTPENSYSGSAIHAHQANRRHQKSTSGQWDSAMNSYVNSPVSSPQNGILNPQISEVAKTVKPQSLPTKVEHGFNSAPPSTIEAKRQKRRQSHNAVERRRRDNINDRIGVLSQLVPPHRLDDDKIRKQISNNNNTHQQGLGGASISPPAATSLLAGGQGRRATGGITQGLPIDDKDKGPAKGDVLAAAVGWTRDLMWLLQRKLQHEAMVSELLDSLGAQVPYEIFDDEWRMRRELQDSIDRNGADNFTYSRVDGSGLWVPGFTDASGTPVQGGSDVQGFGTPGTGLDGPGGGQDYWNFDNDVSTARGSLDLKEEDEFGMELG